MAKLAAAYQDARKFDLALPLLEETLRPTKAKKGVLNTRIHSTV